MRITDPHALVGLRVTVAEKLPDAPNWTFVGIVRSVLDGGQTLVLDNVRELHFAADEGGPTEIIAHSEKVISLANFEVLLCMDPSGA